MSLSIYLKSKVQRFIKCLKNEKHKSYPVIKLEDLKYIWNYQMVVIPNTTIIDLVEPLLDIAINLKKDLENNTHLFPFVVGDNGNLISPTFGRRISFSDKQKISIHLEYPLATENKKKIVLKITGTNPQSISIVLDERKTKESPLILFLWKPRNQ